MLDGMSLSPEKPIPRMTSAFPSQPNNLNESTEGPTIDDDGEYDEGSYVTATFKLTVNERLTVLQTLILRIEETTKEGEQVSAAIEASIEVKAKLDLLKVAMGGRKAQIGFFGGDVCFALLVDICRDRIFEGKMTEQKLLKEYKACREKELGGGASDILIHFEPM
ncbi:hypothetical protein DYB31_005531 [Aphanomyces astaci]|nr:hypothetical protein DYB31_005531 [Aphanomyces astaci]